MKNIPHIGSSLDDFLDEDGILAETSAAAIRPDGKVFTDDSIGIAMASRELMAGLRESGQITGGPPPFSKKDRSRFLQALETVVQAGRRGVNHEPRRHGELQWNYGDICGRPL